MPTVLIADDDDAFRFLLREVMAVQCQVIEATNGRDAVTQAKDALPDLVILDIDMPLLNGMQALALLRADEKTRAIPVLMLTARGGLSDVEALLQAGANDYVIKPLDIKKLRAKVARFIPSARP